MTLISQKSIIRLNLRNAIHTVINEYNQHSGIIMKNKKTLEDLRNEIDAVDQEIVQAINRRTEIVLQVGSLKNSRNAQIYAPDREYEVYKKVFALNNGPIRNKSLESIYREIMSASLALEREIVIAFMGPAGSFSHQACTQKFGSSLPFVAQRTIQDVFKAVEKGECDYGVVPVENSTEGGVIDTLDMFIDTPVKICSEIAVPINNCFMSKSHDVKILERIYSHPQPLGQCRQWIFTHFPHLEVIEVPSTSRAAQMAAEDPKSAAIASELCATINGLNILYKSIQDVARNVTRFAVIGSESPKRTGNDKTSMVIFLHDRVGALYDMLLYFKGHNLNLTRIESRPSKRRPWEYYFFIDFIGHCEDMHVIDLLENLKQHCEFIKILGSYPIYKEPSEEQ